MKVVLNGNQENVEGETSLVDFLKSKGLDPETIIVEHNGKILKKDEWGHVTLQSDDRLEVLKFVGGG